MEIKDINSIEFVEKKPRTVAELSKLHPAIEVVKQGGGRMTNYSGKRVSVNFNPKRPGFITLAVGKEHSVIHVDELVYLCRFAKGNQAI